MNQGEPVPRILVQLGWTELGIGVLFVALLQFLLA